MSSLDNAFPPAPWRLKGTALFQSGLVGMSAARALTPPELAVVPVLPGKTLGGLYYARYTEGSSLQYHELIVVSAVVRFRWKLGAWISHIYVDDLRSEAGGRAIWGLPKQQAQFEEMADQSMSISQAGTRLCSIVRRTPDTWQTLPLMAPVISVKAEGPVWFRGNGRARCGISPGTIDVPAESPFASLKLGAEPGSPQRRQLHLDRLNLVMQPPG
ncbi:MAG: acetoacetate decarboxylase [Alteromonadaceae bacterium]|nr:acetoacetate decarboxylase [Alteromonadaceae bacterium]|tara:strand:- start:5764 stop:6408 length:645 start_codon:yes stop_codon:yes gene_type:complete